MTDLILAIHYQITVLFTTLYIELYKGNNYSQISLNHLIIRPYVSKAPGWYTSTERKKLNSSLIPVPFILSESNITLKIIPQLPETFIIIINAVKITWMPVVA